MSNHSIYKYPVPVILFGRERFTLQMPKGAQILKVALQHGQPCIWALVDRTADVEDRYFRIYGTGHSVDAPPESLTHLGTVLMHDDTFVLHVFEDHQSFQSEQLR